MKTSPPDVLHMTVSFQAPRSLVFQAWTDPALLARWFGPKGFTFETATMDLRPGGTFLYCMKAPSGEAMWGKFVYEEIVAPERLVYVNSFCDEHGTTRRHPLAPSWPLELRNTYTFSEIDGVTTLDMVAHPINATDEEIATFNASKGGVQGAMGATLRMLDGLLADLQRELTGPDGQGNAVGPQPRENS